jgi:predicted DNA-binding transcriptional regulator AlpA
MKWHPYSLAQTPAALPVWQALVMDLGNPHPAVLAKALGLGTRTIYRYHRTGAAPRVVCLALFWMTRWGRSQVNTQAVNDAALAAAYAGSLEAELRHARDQLARVLAISSTGASNDPLERFHAPR